MSEMWPMILCGVLLLAGFVTGLVFLILFLVRSLGGTSGGWRKLADVYATAQEPAGQVYHRETIQVGAVIYKRCATLSIANEGLYVSIFRKTVLIPWTDFKAVGQTSLYWQKVPVLTIGNPPLATITIPGTVFPLLRAKLPPGLV